MGESGQVTKTLDVWADERDESALADAMAAVCAGSWLCSPPAPADLHATHWHPSLVSALACHPAQAFLPLPPTVIGHRVDGEDLPLYDRAVDPSVAIVQYLRGRVRDDVWEPGRLAVRWNRHDVGDALHEQLTAVVTPLFAAARRVLPPAVLLDASGGEQRHGRIGPSARQRVEADMLLLSRRTIVTYTLRANRG